MGTSCKHSRWVNPAVTLHSTLSLLLTHICQDSGWLYLGSSLRAADTLLSDSGQIHLSSLFPNMKLKDWTKIPAFKLYLQKKDCGLEAWPSPPSISPRYFAFYLPSIEGLLKKGWGRVLGLKLRTTASTSFLLLRIPNVVSSYLAPWLHGGQAARNDQNGMEREWQGGSWLSSILVVCRGAVVQH
jgi:hypothetical protein